MNEIKVNYQCDMKTEDSIPSLTYINYYLIIIM